MSRITTKPAPPALSIEMVQTLREKNSALKALIAPVTGGDYFHGAKVAPYSMTFTASVETTTPLINEAFVLMRQIHWMIKESDASYDQLALPTFHTNGPSHDMLQTVDLARELAKQFSLHAGPGEMGSAHALERGIDAANKFHHLINAYLISQEKAHTIAKLAQKGA